MSESNTVEIAGIELSEGDEVSVTYDTELGEKEKSGVIESFMFARSSMMPTSIKFGAHDSVGEDKIVDIEKVV